ncbi:hypothetical protein BCR37DRAFT_399986 [Protomyces lactucae-debilis]|uniref:Translation initiation factor 3 N-terminal domain-containing protein n=1 Tax=Protomyces lactucae-debilis TaxID=2754530 RepID=A0A1Y2F7T7_PROLT|nr:uncharacterized protein BCR37DRAFT_399986 [Protomyces lactucae-debilis]ORY78965.1 hypothetical protein BCR37DRAFT_399986 [Protomyces lactucae-debilis]
MLAAFNARCSLCRASLKLRAWLGARTYATNTKAPRDRDITASQIRFVNAEGQFQGTLSLSQVRRAYDATTHSLVNMTPSQAIPTCRLFALDALKEAETKAYATKRAKKGTSNPAQVTKEVNLSWNVTDHDLEHKLDSGLQALKKGNKVDVSIGVKRKRGAAVPSVQQRSELVTKVKQQLADRR